MDPFQALVPDRAAAQELETLRAELRDLRRLQEAIHFLGSAPDLTSLRGELLDLACSVSGLGRGILALRASADDGPPKYKIKAMRGFEGREARGSREVRLLRRILNRTLETREPLLEGRIREQGILGHAAGSVRTLELGAVACLPLEAKGELLGGLVLDDPEQRAPFSAADTSLLRSFARHAAEALRRLSERSRLARRLARLKRQTDRLEAEREALAREEQRTRAVSERIRAVSQRLRAEPDVKAGQAMRHLLGLPYPEAKRLFTRRYLKSSMAAAEGDLRALSERTGLPVARLIALLHHLDVNPQGSEGGASVEGWGNGVRS